MALRTEVVEAVVHRVGDGVGDVGLHQSIHLSSIERCDLRGDRDGLDKLIEDERAAVLDGLQFGGRLERRGVADRRVLQDSGEEVDGVAVVADRDAPTPGVGVGEGHVVDDGDNVASKVAAVRLDPVLEAGEECGR